MASAVVGTLRVLLEVNAANLEREFDKATIKVGNFDKFTQNAGRNLNRMVESFSGQKIVAEAVRMASALEKVGGVSTLTERELSRVASTVNEATAKLRAMGAEVPPSIAKLHTEIQTLGTKSQLAGGHVGGLTSLVQKFGGVLPIASVAGLATGILRLGKSAIDSAGNIVDLASKTGLSTDAIQRMQAVANQTGTSVETFSQAAFKLGINISEGTTKAKRGISDLGLEYDRLKSMHPEEQFHTVIRALEGVDNAQERNRIGTALFGRQFSEIAASIQQGYSRIADAANVSSDQQLQAIDRAGDAWQKFKDDFNSGLTSMLGEFVLTVNGINAAFDNLKILNLVEILGVGMLAGMRPEELLIAVAKGMNQVADSALRMAPAIDGTATATRSYTERVHDLRMRLVEFTAAERDELDAAIKLEGATEDVADAFGLSMAALKLYQEQQTGSTRKSREQVSATREIKDSTDKAAAAQKKFNDQLREFGQLSTSLHDAVSRGWFGPIETELKDVTSLLSRTITEAGKLDAELLKWAHTNGAVLAPSIRQVRMDVQAVHVETESWRDGLGTLAQALSQLAQVSGESFSEVARWLATVVTAMDVVNKSAGQLRDGFNTFKSGEQTAGFVQMAAGAMTLVAALRQATEGTDKFKTALGGVMAMAGTGNPWLMLAGGIYGYIRGLTSAQEAQRLLGVQFRKDLGEMRAAAQDVMQQAWVLGLDDDLQEMLRTAETQADLERIAELIKLINKNYGELQAEAGGLFDDLMRLAEDAGGIPDSMRDLVEHFRSLGILTDEQAEKLRTLGDSGVVSLDKMKSAAEVIGARFESLGSKFNQERLNTDVMKVVNALDTLIKGGADVGGVLFDARDEISKLVLDSKKFGTTIPANMKPWIDHLFETGNLLDENGDKITDISQIKYGEPLKTEAEKITDAFKTMTQKLLDFFDRLGQEILRIPDRRIKIGVDYDDSGLPPNLRGGGGGGDEESGTFSPSSGSFSAIGPALDPAAFAPVSVGALNSAFSAGSSPAVALADTSGSSMADRISAEMGGVLRTLRREDQDLFVIAVRDAVRGAV